MRRLVRLLVLACLAMLASPGQAEDDKPAPRSVFLIANEDMADPRFRETVVLVTRHGRSRSTIGVIVNRPFAVTLDQVFPEFSRATDHRLHYGGPVAQGQIVFLVRGDTPPKAAIALTERLFISSDGESLRRLLEAATPDSRLRVFRGFASWAPNQLEAEIDRGDWYLLPVDTDALFNDPLDALWPKLWRRATQVMVRAPAPVLRVEFAAWRPALR